MALVCPRPGEEQRPTSRPSGKTGSPRVTLRPLLHQSPRAGLHPQACKPWSCPTLRPKKGPRDSDRDINGLLDGGTLHV